MPVFPTLVGVFPPDARPDTGRSSLPHARGGVSGESRSPSKSLVSSPRSWGGFRFALREMAIILVFPTLVGVFPLPGIAPGLGRSLPHARGGVSILVKDGTSSVLSSPRSWGCFRAKDISSSIVLVFPTLVGVFLMLGAMTFPCGRLPHARGGVSAEQSVRTQQQVSSPRSWGCFRLFGQRRKYHGVFPTLVGVFLKRV